MASGAAPISQAMQAGAPGTPMVEATRVYHFCAAHRLHNPRFDPAENARIYGRCNNPSGHGHTYRLEVTIRGPVSAATGRVEGGEILDRAVRSKILECFDRMNLDLLIGAADGPTATTEVVAAMFWRILEGALPVGRLWRLRLEETPHNFFEMDREGVGQAARSARPSPPRRGQKASVA